MNTQSRWILRASVAVIAVALCAGGAALFTPAEAAVDDAASSWRITDHPGANLPTDPESIAAREIYPGVTLGQVDYSPAEVEWALHQKPLGDAASVIETEFAADYAYAYFGPERSFTVGFSDDAPAGALALLDHTGLPYSTVEGLGFNDARYQHAVTILIGEVSHRLDRADLLGDGLNVGALFHVSSDTTTAPGAIVVSVSSADESIREAAIAAVGTLSADPPFTVTVVRGDENELVLYG